ncbi:MAG: CcmD family protein [Anaerolineae bacterium]|nr:CcmD family protein [Anaerolineae bacterium]
MDYLFAAYGVFWALTFIFVFTIGSRQKRLEKEIEALKKELEKEER